MLTLLSDAASINSRPRFLFRWRVATAVHRVPRTNPAGTTGEIRFDSIRFFFPAPSLDF
jgi:hypothetical protein